MFKSIWNFSDERKRLVKMLQPIPRDTPILDVGCGYGRNLELLRQFGFTNLTGVDINRDLVEQASARGFSCFLPEQIGEGNGEYGLLLMSHIVEHFEFTDLRMFIENYLRFLCDGGKLVIVTPLFHNNFYNDFDHVKPYLPMGFAMVFGDKSAQVQFQSNHVLQLENIDFFKDQLRVQFHPSLFLNASRGWPIQQNRILKLIYVLSMGYVGKKVGWMGVYQYMGISKNN